MEPYYEVLYGSETVGKVAVQHQGLYYRFQCRCQIPDNRVCRLVLQWLDSWENIGILIPEGDGMVLDRKLPSKRIRDVPPVFRLIPSGQDIEKTLFPEPAEEAEEPEQQHFDGEQEEPVEQMASYPREEQLHSQGNAEFTPVEDGGTFDKLEDLEQGIFTTIDEKPGILLQKSSQDYQNEMESPTGQWSDPMISE